MRLIRWQWFHVGVIHEIWAELLIYIQRVINQIHSTQRQPICSLQGSLRPAHNTMLNNALHCVVFASTLVETQHNARIDSDPILVFPCVAFLHLVLKNPQLFLVINLCISRINATQDLASLCEPAFRVLIH